MAPTYSVGDRLLVDRLVFEWRDPRRWEVVVFRGPDGIAYVKRIAGLPGETVQVVDGGVEINGERVPGPAAPYEPAGRHGNQHPHRLGEDEFFVLGDNSPASNDSRHWPDPAVKRSALIGKPVWNRR
jgi:signal peptidase I